MCDSNIPSKKLKLSDQNSYCGNDDVVTVLHEKYYAASPIEDVFVAQIVNPKCCKELITLLKRKFPLSHLAHLKRISSKQSSNGKDLRVILSSKCNDNDQNSLVSCLQEANLLPVIGDIAITQVASNPPLTRKQFNNANSLWPTSFHEDKRIKSLVENSFFSSAEITEIKEYMNTGISQVQLSSKSNIGFCIVDPSTKTILAKGHNLKQLADPLMHTSMIAIDMIAFRQGGGALNLDYCFQDSCVTMMDQDSDMKGSKGSKEGYLCTGLDLYITSEPCIMCSMALLHSRIRRVFYGFENRINGGLGGSIKLHTMKHLNHHFDVFKGISREQCKQLSDH